MQTNNGVLIWYSLSCHCVTFHFSDIFQNNHPHNLVLSHSIDLVTLMHNIHHYLVISHYIDLGTLIHNIQHYLVIFIKWQGNSWKIAGKCIAQVITVTTSQEKMWWLVTVTQIPGRLQILHSSSKWPQFLFQIFQTERNSRTNRSNSLALDKIESYVFVETKNKVWFSRESVDGNYLQYNWGYSL